MSLQKSSIPPISSETALVAKAAFPSGNVYMQMRDELGSIYDDALFASVYAEVGQPTIVPWRLALVSVMQFTENLSDRQAVEAVRARIDWSLELVGETLRHALNVLATVVPEWLKQQVKSEWFDRYGQRMEDYRLPKEKSERAALSATIGEDGFFLLTCIQQAPEMQWLSHLPAIQTLSEVWKQQYRWSRDRSLA